MANIKAPHMKNDSNPFRQKKNEEEKLKLKEQFKSTDLMNIPSHCFVRNMEVYKSLVRNLTELNLGIHLNSIDVYSLVSIANTFDLIHEIESDLKKYGTHQSLQTKDGIKLASTPFTSMRTQQINLLNQQLIAIQIDPKSRQLLTNSVLNDVNMFNMDFDSIEDDEDIQSIIAKAISGGL